MKEVLEYTEEELRKLPIEVLKKLLDDARSGERQYWTEQTGLKLIINSLYGAFANRWFPLFDEKMAQAITGAGRFFIRTLAKNIETKLQSMHPSEKLYMSYSDTDSCVGDTLVKTSLGDIKIEDLFDLDGDIEVRGENNYINHLSEIITGASVNEKLELQYKQIKYVMKHKVKKQMFKITIGNKSVTITCDHSLMVVRGGKLIEVKPTELLKTDKLVKIREND